jgi:hypothetical protein
LFLGPLASSRFLLRAAAARPAGSSIGTTRAEALRSGYYEVQERLKTFNDSLSPDRKEKLKEFHAFKTDATKQAFVDSLRPDQRGEYVELVLSAQRYVAGRKALQADVAGYQYQVQQEQAFAAQQQANGAGQSQNAQLRTLLRASDLVNSMGSYNPRDRLGTSTMLRALSGPETTCLPNTAGGF